MFMLIIQLGFKCNVVYTSIISVRVNYFCYQFFVLFFLFVCFVLYCFVVVFCWFFVGVLWVLFGVGGWERGVDRERERETS